jgi:hypothetical protein
MNLFESVNPRDFTFKFIESQGGILEQIDDDLYRVLLPSEPDRLITFTFEPEIARQIEGCNLIGYGTPTLDRILDISKREGKVSEVYIGGLHLKPVNLEQILSWSININGGALYLVDSKRFNFNVS